MVQQNSTFEHWATAGAHLLAMPTTAITGMTRSSGKKVRVYFKHWQAQLIDRLYSVCELGTGGRDQENHQGQRDHEGRRHEMANQEQGWPSGTGDPSRQ